MHFNEILRIFGVDQFMSGKGKIRIIGGRYRGRKISVVHEKIRPTSDRVRETLFNWLDSRLDNKCCLDLFAGTGILGIEALSRGAKKVVFVDHRQSIVSEIQNQITRLELHDSSVILSDSLSYLDNPSYVQPFDIIFLDPPFGTYNLEKLLSHIFETEWLDSHGMVYYESNHSLESNLINSSWDKYRESKAGNVYYGLLTKKISN